MNDIQHREDIEHLVDTFYKEVVEDKIIGYIFNDVVPLDWEKHIPIMYDFWETILLGKIRYKGSPIPVHIALSQRESLLPIHFERWIQIWETVVRTNFSGEKANEAVKRAKLMGELIQIKIKKSKEDGFIQ
ncbi:MAG: group III truncated hemoglobin [Cyclobacteriaceae bacterium]